MKKTWRTKCRKNGGEYIITDKQKKFADIYIQCLNATEAYMKSYGAKDRNTAAKMACRLKKNNEVRGYIEKELDEISKRARMNAGDILELLTDIAFTSPAYFAKITTEGEKQKILWKDIDTMPDEIKRAIAVIKNAPGGIVIETLDRMKAIDMLMKYMGISKNGDGGVRFEGEGDIEE